MRKRFLLIICCIMILPYMFLFSGCDSKTPSVNYIDYEMQTISDENYAIFQFEVCNPADSLYNSGLIEYKFFFEKGNYVMQGFITGIYYNAECTNEVEITTHNEFSYFYTDKNSTQTYYVKVNVPEEILDFNKISVVRANSSNFFIDK